MLKCGGVQLELSDLEDIDFSVYIYNSMIEVFDRSHKIVNIPKDQQKEDKKKTSQS